MNYSSDRKRKNSAVRAGILRICCMIAVASFLLVGVFLLGAWWQRRSIEIVDVSTEGATQRSEKVEADLTALRGDVTELQGKIDEQTGELMKLGEKLTQLERDQLPHANVENAEPAAAIDPTTRLLELIPVEVERGMLLDVHRNWQWREVFSPSKSHYHSLEVRLSDGEFFYPDSLPELQDFENERPKP